MILDFAPVVFAWETNSIEVRTEWAYE